MFKRWCTHTHVGTTVHYTHTPVQWLEAAGIQWQSVLRTGAVVDQPAADAGAAVRVFTGRLKGALQHVPTHTAEEAFIHVAHKPIQIIAHPATKTCKCVWERQRDRPHTHTHARAHTQQQKKYRKLWNIFSFVNKQQFCVKSSYDLFTGTIRASPQQN